LCMNRYMHLGGAGREVWNPCERSVGRAQSVARIVARLEKAPPLRPL
jgi:hypothetical protein